MHLVYIDDVVDELIGALTGAWNTATGILRCTDIAPDYFGWDRGSAA